MGRQAGWLAASAALAKGNDCSGADAIYLPERVFDMDAFVSFVEQTAQRKKTIVIALSEGIKTADGKYVCEHSESPEGTDAFGHKQLSGCGLVLSDVITARLGYKTRVIEISTLQRSAAHLESETDVEEAAAAGRHGVCAAVAGESGVMVVFERIQNHPYLCNTKTFDIHDIANGERPVPDEWITEDGLGLKEEFLEYVRPLIKGECAPVYVDGLPYHLVRK
jgi:6-phosphofructokinase 1